jgi:hypothetical protein
MPHVRRLPFAAPLLALALATALSGCAVTFVPGDPVDVLRPTPPTDVVRPDPSRPDGGRPVVSATLPGDGSILQFEVAPNTIRPSTTLTFRTRFARAGYLTVSALAPNGRVEVLLRNVPVAPGFQLVPPVGAPPSERIQASAPTGRWVVRAQFAEVRTAARYQNVQGYDAWTVAVADDLRGAANASVFETSYEVEQR